MPPKRPLAVSSSSAVNIEDEAERKTKAKVSSVWGRLTKKRIVEDKGNKTRPVGKTAGKERKALSTLTSMYGDDDDDELEEIVPKKAAQPSKPRASNMTRSKKAKPREPTPEEITEESTLDSIQIQSQNTSPETSFDEASTSIEQPTERTRPKGRTRKSISATPQPQQSRSRSGSVQPQRKAKSTPASTAKTRVKGRKQNLAVVPETQVDMDVVQEVDEVEEVELALTHRRVSNSVLPPSMTKTSIDRAPQANRIKELQSQAERNFALYKERAEKRFKATDELVKSLTAQLEYQKESVDPSQVKALEAKVKSLQDELQRANAALANETSQNAILTARIATKSQSNTAQLREELHSDLSGLIFRNVERLNGNTIFDCLQIGRNGTLHYKLTMEDKDVNDTHGQIVYTPHLDPNRDAKILNVLPDYLTDEIMFAREQASMFYWRLNQYLQKKAE